MRICIFCHDAYMSGAEMSLYDWVSCDREDTFLIVLPHRNIKSPFLELDNVALINGGYFCFHKEMTKKPLLFTIKKGIKKIYMRSIGRVELRILEDRISKWSPEVIISNSFSIIYGAIISHSIGIRHIWHIREFMQEDHQITHINEDKIRKLTAISDAIFISHAIEDYYLKKYIFRKTTVIYNQIRLPDREEIQLPKLFRDDQIRIIIAGTLQENKGQMDAIRAIEIVHNQGLKAELDIYGEGPLKNRICDYINERNLGYIHVKGYSNNLMGFRSNYDISLVCSKMEAFGRVTIESMACGNIVIGTKAGGNEELIRDGLYGFLYTPGNVEELANLIVYCHNNQDFCKEIQQKAYKWAYDNFSSPIYKMIRSFIEES